MPTESGADFTIGEVFERSALVFGRHVVWFVLVGGLLMLPYFFVLSTHINYAFPVRRIVPVLTPGIAAYFTASGSVGYLLQCFSETVIVWGAFQVMRGRPVEIGASLLKGVHCFLWVTGISICQSAGLFVAYPLLGGHGWTARIVGFVALVPGLIIGTVWFVAPSAYVIERRGIIGSLRRSAALTKGHRWKIMGTFIFMTIAGLIVVRILHYGVREIGSTPIALIATYIFDGGYLGFSTVLGVAFYRCLRIAKEGGDPETIAKVFD